MTEKTLLVVGASGDVGQGIVGGARAAGWRVVAAARSLDRLTDLFGADAGVAVRPGDLSDDASAQRLWQAAEGAFGGIDAVIVSVNVAAPPKPILAWTSEELTAFYAANILSHQVAARAFLPKLARDALFIGIGGGTADFIIPKMAPISMAQAALRMFYRGLARENREGPPIRELMIVSMVAAASNRENAAPEWITDADIGRHVAAILDAPEAFPGPILQLTSREQVGRTEVAA